MSTRQPADVSRLPSFLLLGAFAALAVYLACGVPMDGDGAVYTLQALDGSPWERSVHVGYLAPLTAWVQGGLPPEAFGWLWGGVGLVLLAVLGRQQLERRPRDPRLPPAAWPGEAWAPWIAPAAVLCSAATWRGAGTVEVYLPLAVLLVGAAVALGAGRPVAAGLALGGAGLVHPGAWALAPGVVILGLEPGAPTSRPRRRRATARDAWIAVGVGGLLFAVAVGWLWGDWWRGERGIAAVAAGDVGPWGSAQRLWRLLAGDVGPVAVVVLAGAALLPRRAILGVGLVVVGSVVGLDRYSDNAGHLPALWLLAGAAPLAVRWIDELGDGRMRGVAQIGLPLLLVLGVAEATSRHDADVRRAEREATALVEEHGCEAADPGLPWRDAARLELLCR